MPLIGEKFAEIRKMKECLKYMLKQFEIKTIEEALKQINQTYIFKKPKQCQRLVNASGNVSVCKAPLVTGYRTCKAHMRHYQDDVLDLILPLLPSKLDEKELNFFERLFRSVVDLDEKHSEKDLKAALEKYFGDLITYTSSDLFE